MLRGHVVPRPADGSLEQRPHGLYRVGVDSAAKVLGARVVHAVVAVADGQPAGYDPAPSV